MWLERLTGSQEVVGSNPIFSTIKHSKNVDKTIKSPANLFVRALLFKTFGIQVQKITFVGQNMGKIR